MPEYPHFFLENNAINESFKRERARGSSTHIPDRERAEHSRRLLNRLEEIWADKERTEAARAAEGIGTRDGTYLSFHSSAGFDLLTRSLEDLRSGIRLLNITTSGEGVEEVTTATVYVPRGKEGHFVKKILDYQDDDKLSEYGRPRNMKLVNSIEDIGQALLESLWTDAIDMLPGDDSKWCEVWLRVDTVEDHEIEDVETFLGTLEDQGLSRKPNILIFPERAVLLVQANQDELVELMLVSNQLAELRSGQEASFWTNQGFLEQHDWVDSLSERLNILTDPAVKVCILDTGVNNGHPLLAPVLADADMHTVDPTWGTDDHDPGAGHGTLMAGLATYGDLDAALASNGDVHITHRLCSVKVLPRPGQTGTRKELWGDITQQAVYRAEAQSPGNVFVYCMAITAQNDSSRGRPSSWSGAVDSLCYGEGENQRLILISGGNVRDPALWPNYPDSNIISSVENPAQSWNAVTIGAYTRRTRVNDAAFNAYACLASDYQLSPFSTTSRLWERKWGAKPDVVFEGGNLLRAPDGSIIGHDDLGILSTSRAITTRPFATINATSAATAEAAWFAAKVLHEYPNIWPETTRALLIHSASWTDEMLQQSGAIAGNRESYAQLLRMFGYGIPDLERATKSYENALTFVAQEEIQPFAFNENSRPITNELHMYLLPWPEQELLDLGQIPVRLKVTLSYFIEPGPGEIGWKDKYRYQSHALRFDVNNVGETHDQFRARINVAAREDEAIGAGDSGSSRWAIGSANINRTTGSIHSDYWEGTAAELATCSSIAVYPVIGWWRERHHLGKVDNIARYTLVVSLETPEMEVELYTAVKNIIETQIEVHSI